MRLRSFTTVVIRIMGMMSLIYGLIMLIFVLVTLSMLSGFGSDTRIPGMSSMIWLQVLLPILMCLLGIIFIAVSRPLANALCGGLED